MIEHIKRAILLCALCFSFKTVTAQNAHIYLFWSENCPACMFYGPELREIQNKFHGQLNWHFVFPNLSSTDSSASTYLSKNKLIGKVIVAEAADWVNKYAIEVTPEVVLTNDTGMVLYIGRIDNSYEKIGRRRPKATETELADRLQKLADNQPFPYIRTRAVGCFLH